MLPFKNDYQNSFTSLLFLQFLLSLARTIAEILKQWSLYGSGNVFVLSWSFHGLKNSGDFTVFQFISILLQNHKKFMKGPEFLQTLKRP